MFVLNFNSQVSCGPVLTEGADQFLSNSFWISALPLARHLYKLFQPSLEGGAVRTLNDVLFRFMFGFVFLFQLEQIHHIQRPCLAWHQDSVCLQKQNASSPSKNKELVPRLRWHTARIFTHGCFYCRSGRMSSHRLHGLWPLSIGPMSSVCDCTEETHVPLGRMGQNSSGESGPLSSEEC